MKPVACESSTSPRRRRRAARSSDLTEPGDEGHPSRTPVGGDEARARALRLPQALLQFCHVAVGVAVALRLAQANAVDDARVIERVEITASRSSRSVSNRPPLASKQDEYRITSSVPRNPARPLLECLVGGLRAANEAHRGHTVAVLIDRALRRRTHHRVVGETQVVIGAQVDDVALAGAYHAAWGPASTRSLL